MLKANLGIVEVRGTTIDLMAELAQLIHTLVEKGVMDKDDVNKCVELAFKSEDEVKELNKDIDLEIADMLRSLADDFEKGKKG